MWKEARLRKWSAWAGPVLLALNAWGNLAYAGSYAGGGLGLSQFDYPDLDDGTAVKFAVGYELESSPAYFELAYFDSGDVESTDSADAVLKIRGFSLAVGFRAEFSPNTGSALFFKGGLYDTDAKATVLGSDFRDSGTGIFLGLGLDWMLTSNFGLRLDFDYLSAVEDLASNKDVTFITAGPVIKFGAR